jgi:hypothetical protein
VSDTQVKEEAQGESQAGEAGGGLAENGGEIDGDEEDALFDQMATDRAAGASLSKTAGLAEPGAAGEGEGDEPGAGADAQAKADADKAKAEADKAKAEADAASAAAADADKGKAEADAKAKEDAEAKAKAEASTDAAAGAEADLEAEFMKALGETDISPDDATEAEKMNVARFAELYPSVHKRVMLTAKFMEQRHAAQLQALRDEFAPVVRAYGRERLLDQIDGEGEGRMVGARQLANDPGFHAWLEKQSQEVKALGQTPDPANNLKLLQAFASSKAKGGGRTRAERDAALDVARGSATTTRRPANLQVPVRASVAAEIDEDEADAEFNRLAAERGKK